MVVGFAMIRTFVLACGHGAAKVLSCKTGSAQPWEVFPAFATRNGKSKASSCYPGDSDSLPTMKSGGLDDLLPVSCKLVVRKPTAGVGMSSFDRLR